MSVWDTSTPAGTDPISQGDDRIREAKSAIEDALRAGEADGDEAIFPGPNPSTDPIFRPRGGYGDTASRPAAAVGGLYFNTDTGTLQRSNGTSWDELAENAAYEAIHQKVTASLASVAGVVTLPETGNSFNVSGSEAVTAIQGWSAGIVIVKWTAARTLTHGASFYLMEGLSRVVSSNDISVFEFTGSNAVREIVFHGAKLLPTRQIFTTGSGTYTTPAGCRQIKVRMVGGGGGGGSGNTNNGAVGVLTAFNSIQAAPGAAGAAGSAGSNAAGGSGGAGTASFRVAGATGGASAGGKAGDGGNSLFGGAGAGAAASANGANAATNSGSGGGGAAGASDTGNGGGAGEYVELVISNPGTSYSYSVGAGGAGGSAVGGAGTGGAGGSGLIIVDEVY